MHITTIISAVITLLGALVVVIWMPGRGTGPGRPANAEPSAGTAEVAGQGELVPAAAGIPASPATRARTFTPVTPGGTVLPVAGGSTADGVTPAGRVPTAGPHSPSPVRAEG
jgi:hypothetical protein